MPTPPQATLLVVDDEPEVLEILTRTFERRYEVLAAPGGQQALDLLRSREAAGAPPVDVLITDQKMPHMTGVELVARARAQGFEPTAILLTGYADPDDVIAAINRGQVFRYLTKPWELQDLMLAVKTAAEHTQLRRDKDRLLAQLKQRMEALSVFHEVSQRAAEGAVGYDAIIDRVLSAVARVLPYDCGAALIAVDEAHSATLRLRCRGVTGEKGLLWVKETVLASYRKHSGRLLSEDRIVTRVSGTTRDDHSAPGTFASSVYVPLLADGRPVGTLALFSHRRGAYSQEDGELLDVLANQTASAIRALRASEEEGRRRIERMVESMADGVVLTDEQDQVRVCNPAARTLLRLSDEPQSWTGQKLAEALGFSPFELVRGWEYGGKKVLRQEVTVGERALAVTITPVVDGAGALRAVCLVLRDVTDQKQLEARKDEFVSVVSHELRTPLTAISGALDLVVSKLTGPLNDKQVRYLTIAKDSTDKLNGLVDDLLDLAKSSQGRLRMSFQVAYLDELVRAAAERYGPAFQERGLRLTTRVQDGSLRALVDPGRLHQVLDNLLTNAVKFTPEGGQVELSLQTAPELPGYATLALWNTGEAIPIGDLERIFEKFEQARSPRTKTVRGTGLGLTICRRIVEAHGGRIWAEPCADGARLLVVLPLDPSMELLQQAADAEVSPLPEIAPRGTLLLVDDEPTVAFALKGLLLANGWRVAIAHGADEALVLARELRPEVILLDVCLPGGVDGLALAEIFRHDPDTHHAALVVMSGADERARAFRQGASAFLPKPLQHDSLLATLESVSQGRAAHPRGVLLVVDDDLHIAAICQEVLSNLGFAVRAAASLAEARRALRELRPDVVLLDVTLPDGEGFELLEELKAERAGSHLPVIFISARAETASKVRAFKLGGDDYLVKPFDALELGARVESVLRRREAELECSPTTQLPGSLAIEREVDRRLREGRPFAFCYLDLDNLKAYNDYYGFAKADGVVKQTGDLLRETFAQHGLPGDFLGHVAGDDFVFVASPTSVDVLCQRIIEAFDRIIPLYYDRQDRERGHIEAEDRFGERRKFPIMSVSIVAVLSDGPADHAGLARKAAELKGLAKARAGSVYLRSDSEPTVRSIA